MTFRNVCAITLSTALFFITACGSSSSSPAGSGSIVGSVLNPPNPVSGVAVTATGPGGTFTTTTSNTGAFRIDNVPVGTYTVALSGKNVFDSAGNPVPDKVSISFGGFAVGTGDNVVSGKPVFLPQEAIGTNIDTGGTTTAVIPADTVIENEALGVSIIFETATTITFQDNVNTTISITQVPLEHIPMSLPANVSTNQVVTIQPPGATFDIRPKVVFPNTNSIPAGTIDVPLYRFDHDLDDWVAFGTGKVSADGTSVISDPGQGLVETGWHGATVQTFCTTTVAGNVQDGGGTGIPNVLVTTVNGATGVTDANGDYSIANVGLPSATFNVVVTALPPNNGGFQPNDSTSVIGVCDGTTTAPNIVLAGLTIDTTAPTVLSTVPADAAVGVDYNSVVTITFDEPMSPGSLNGANIDLVCGGTAVPGVIGINGNTITFLPTTLLPETSDCTIRVGVGVLDAAGNPLATEFTATFTTAVASTPGTASVTLAPVGPVGLNPGGTQLLTPTVLDAAGNPVAGALVTYTSDAPNVASADSTGLVTANGLGTANITSTFGAATDVVVVNVTQTVPTATVVTPATQDMAIGSVQRFTAEANAGGPPLSGYSFTWASDNAAMATVDASGTVTAVSAGVVTITATEPVSGTSDTVVITVIDTAAVNSVTVTPSTAAVEVGASQQLSAQGFDSSSTLIPGLSFTWTTSDALVATVNSSGVVTGVATGSATITGTADNSGGVFGTATVSVFLDTSLVVLLKGAAQETDPLPGIRVLRHDSVTGAFIEELTTDSAGLANFGMIGAPRTTITLFFDFLVADNEAELFSLVDIEVGALTLTLGACPDGATFDVQVSNIPAGSSDQVIVSMGGYGEGDDFQGFGSPPSITVFGVEVCELQADGNVSMIISSTDSSTGEPTAAAFLLDQDPATLDSMTVPVNVDPLNLTSVPWTSATPTSATGGLVQRNGTQWDEFFGFPTPATSGNAFLAIPPGANMLDFVFEADTTGGAVGIDYLFATVPSSITVDMPDLQVASLSRNGSTNTVSWSITGTDAGDLDLLFGELSYQDGSSNFIEWGFLLAPTATSFTTLGLPGNMAGLIPPVTGVAYQIEGTNLDNVVGFDALLLAIQPFMGNFEKYFMGSGITTATFVERGKVTLTISIGGTGTGTVTIDSGSGPVAVNDGDVLELDEGTTITVAANAAATFNVTNLNCPFGQGTGVGTPSATCGPFELFGGGGATVAVDFN